MSLCLPLLKAQDQQLAGSTWLGTLKLPAIELRLGFCAVAPVYLRVAEVRRPTGGNVQQRVAMLAASLNQ